MSEEIVKDSGLIMIETNEGDGVQPVVGQTVVAHYDGYLEDGTVFDSSVSRGTPFEFPVGMGKVIKGWDEAFLDMKVGSKRTLIIPSELGYGERGAWNYQNTKKRLRRYDDETCNNKTKTSKN